MSTANFIDQIEYPESDGRPMGETDLHRHWMIWIYDLLQHRYRNQDVYIASDLLVYFEPRMITRVIVPDVFVVFDCPPGNRRVFKTWEEQRVPHVVFEVTSRGTSSTDVVDKPKIYEAIGVQEYFLYDPTAEYLRPSLQGYRLTDGRLREIPVVDGVMRSLTLGVHLRLNEQALEMLDGDTGEPLLTAAEAYELEAETQRANAETQRAKAETQRANAETQRNTAQRERAARLAAEAQLRTLQEELDRLRRERSQDLGNSPDGP